MDLRNVLAGPDIHEGLARFRNTPGGILVDVRTPEEYAQGHLPGSLNIPLQNITQVEELVKDRDKPLFVYCHSGTRSRRAAGFFRKIGYEQVDDLGGIVQYSGELEKSDK